MESPGYWDKIARKGVSRRRVLAFSGASAAAAFLMACGGSDSSSSSSSASTPGGDSSGLLYKPVDTTKDAKKGGVFKDSAVSDAQYFLYDQNLNGNGSDGLAGWVYSRLVQYRVGTANKLPDGSVDADFAQGWEVSPDGLTVTFKVRDGLKWDSRPPTNNRPADSSDITYSWDRWIGKNSKAPSLANAKDPFGPVLSVTATDDKTAVIKLAYPYPPLLSMLAFIFHPLIMPREADGGFDVRNTARGTGAWLVQEQQPSVILKLRRNPNWYGKERPYLDGWDLNIIPDYAQGTAQLKAGNLDTYNVRQEDIVATKKDSPNLVLTQLASFPKNNGGWLYFGLQGDSPFNDERVRKAFSMEIDRDAWVDTFSNKERFAAAGLPASHAISNFAGAGFSSYMDPRSKDMGDAAAFFQYSPSEAKKLLSAAGFTVPINVPFVIPSVGADQQPQALAGGVTSVGDFKLDFKSINFQQDFIPNYQLKKGDFKGIIYLGQAESPDYDWVMFNTFYKGSANFYSKTEDPKVSAFIDSQRRESDTKKRDDILKDFQRYVGSKMYLVPMPGTWKTFTLSQPWIGNFGYYVPWLGATLGGAGPSQVNYTYYWSDDSKRAK